MKPYAEICNDTPHNFKRETGLSKENVNTLFAKIKDYIALQKARYPLSKRGK